LREDSKWAVSSSAKDSAEWARSIFFLQGPDLVAEAVDEKDRVGRGLVERRPRLGCSLELLPPLADVVDGGKLVEVRLVGFRNQLQERAEFDGFGFLGAGGKVGGARVSGLKARKGAPHSSSLARSWAPARANLQELQSLRGFPERREARRGLRNRQEADSNTSASAAATGRWP
jgi:hypothetical protein